MRYILDRRKAAPTSGTMDIHGLSVGGLDPEADFIDFSDESASGDPTKRTLFITGWKLGWKVEGNANGCILYRDENGLVTKLAIGTEGQQCIVEDIGGGDLLPRWGTAKRTIQLLATAGKARTTSGCGDLTQAETSTNKVNYDYLPFDKDTDEYAYWPAFALSNWDADTITFRVAWTAASGSGGVAWALQGLARSNDDALDATWGTAVIVTDTLLATGDVHWSAWSSALTVGGTPAAGDIVLFQIYRDVSDAADTLSGDAHLLAIEILYTTSSYTDG